jgi:lipoprotein-releasing system ATP-binding protein
MPLLIRREDRSSALEKARKVLGELGLGNRCDHMPGELSGGERQRCAFARAMVTAPACVLADEPTGNLDHKTADEVFEAMMRLSAAHGTAFVLVTHDAGLAARAGRSMELVGGKLQTR